MKNLVEKTREERKQLINDLRANIGHKCQVVPFNTIEWADGHIAGITEDPRSGSISYIIKVGEKRITKSINSNLLKISDEVIETKPKRERIELTSENLEAEIMKLSGNVGKLCTFSKNEVEIKGRILSIIADKRVDMLLYKIIDLNTNKNLYKVTSAADLIIEESFDEDGQAINTKFIERRQSAFNKANLTPQEKINMYEQEVKKLEEKLEKAKQDLENKLKQLQELKATLQ